MVITEEELEYLDRAHRRTTQGSWAPFPLTNGYHDVRVQEPDGIWESIGCAEEAEDNGLFCCMAHDKVPALIAEVRRLREENEWTRAVQKAERGRYLFWLSRIKNIRALADARLKLTPSTDEACVLWQIARATEGE